MTYTYCAIAFPDFDDDIDGYVAQLPFGWEDNSWKNDTCPHLELPNGVRLWIDYADPQKSEYPESRLDGTFKRFMAGPWSDEPLFETDVWSVMHDWLWANHDKLRAMPDDNEPERNDENIYDLASIRQSIEEERK